VQAAQQEGSVRADIPAPNLLGFCAGSLAMPILFGGAVLERGAAGAQAAHLIEAALLSDAALDQRIELALSAISLSPSRTSTRKPRKRGTKAKP
jgi:hypothetical protein